MNISEDRIVQLLHLVSHAIVNTENPDMFDMEQFFLNHDCSARLADLLSDYLPTACGQAFCNEREIGTSKFYQRMDANGNLGPEQRYEDDQLWKTVKHFSEQLATSSETRKQFGALARQSEHVDALNKALNDGMSWEELKGATFGTDIFQYSLL